MPFGAGISQSGATQRRDKNTSGKRISVRATDAMARRQLVHMLLFNVGPAIGTAVAIIWQWRFGFSLVDAALLATFYAATIIGVEVGFHRCFAHRAFYCSGRMQTFLAALGCAAAQGPTGYWVANHRRHHAFCDDVGDPHSPKVGFWHSHMGWLASRDVTLSPAFAPDMLASKAIQRADRRYFTWIAVALVLPGVLGAALTLSAQGAISGFLWGGLARLFLVQQGTFLVNSACHKFGSRQFRSGDQSRNLSILSVPTFGGSLHNNHHAFPRSATTALGRGEIDPSGAFIRVLARLGVFWQPKIPSAAELDAKRLA